MFNRGLALLRRKIEFVDSVKILLASGSGGDGASVMLHEHGNEFAGPGGGNGGNGGNVMVRCVKHVHDLRHIHALGAQTKANDGAPGYSRQAHGRRGRDLWLEVPVGTEIVDVDTNEVVYDLSEPGTEVLLLEGGQGGKGNAAFANKWHHSPVESTSGLPGNSMLAQFELKSIADCGLIGYPNAGKSSILSAISSSKPKIAPYAFTTLQPYVGVLYDLYGNTCRVADIPGLMEGAFENRGLGHQFLRHVERTKTLAYVVDMHETFNPDPKYAPLEPWEVIDLLQSELEYYLPNLSERAVMVFANKMDLETDAKGRALTDKLEELCTRVPHLPIFPVSAALGNSSLGPSHPSANFTPALEHLCGEVFKRKQDEREIQQYRKADLDEQLYSVFKNQNNGIFAPPIQKLKKFTLAEEEELHAMSQQSLLGDEAYGDLNLHGGSVDSEGYSLVDQQLGDAVGNSGLGDVLDGYETSIARNRLIAYRDLTLKGKYTRSTADDRRKKTTSSSTKKG